MYLQSGTIGKLYNINLYVDLEEGICDHVTQSGSPWNRLWLLLEALPLASIDILQLSWRLLVVFLPLSTLRPTVRTISGERIYSDAAVSTYPMD